MRKRRFAPLYDTDVYYQRENKKRGMPERWQTITDVYRRGYGDCEDLAAIRVAELRRERIRAVPWFRRKNNIWHVVVKYPNGKIEDPSRILGMGQTEG